LKSAVRPHVPRAKKSNAIGSVVAAGERLSVLASAYFSPLAPRPIIWKVKARLSRPAEVDTIQLLNLVGLDVHVAAEDAPQQCALAPRSRPGMRVTDQGERGIEARKAVFEDVENSLLLGNRWQRYGDLAYCLQAKSWSTYSVAMRFGPLSRTGTLQCVHHPTTINIGRESHPNAVGLHYRWSKLGRRKACARQDLPE